MVDRFVHCFEKGELEELVRLAAVGDGASRVPLLLEVVTSFQDCGNYGVEMVKLRAPAAGAPPQCDSDSIQTQSNCK